MFRFNRSKKLAVEWGQQTAEVKLQYSERAEADKERYAREFALYRETDEYKCFVEGQQAKSNDSSELPATAAAAAAKAASGKKPGKKRKKGEGVDHPEDEPSEGVKREKASSSGSDPSGSSSSVAAAAAWGSSPHGILDIPIFREEFLEHNKAREAELKSLRRRATEFEEQNAVLQKHVENLRTAIVRLEQEVSQCRQDNSSLSDRLDRVRRSAMSGFSGVAIPSQAASPSYRSGKLSLDNIDDYVAELNSIISNSREEDRAFISKVRAIAAKMDLTDLLAP